MRSIEASAAAYNFTFLKLQISLSVLRVGTYFRPSWYGIGYKMEERNLSSSDLFLIKIALCLSFLTSAGSRP